ncbi:MAG: hypothetical protein LIO96_00375 [Lachnospiraceae bacterium]|nr:hypothetical protein [Lachnospiraceae bacterium]MCC8154204.1 hypothetical protein [Tannerellaceae bacterium]
MDMISVLKSIEGEFILNIDGTEQSCENGAVVLDVINPAVVYAIQKIGVKDGKVYIEVCDQTDVIAQQNKVWMEAEKAKTGVESSFF